MNKYFKSFLSSVLSVFLIAIVQYIIVLLLSLVIVKKPIFNVYLLILAFINYTVVTFLVDITLFPDRVQYLNFAKIYFITTQVVQYLIIVLFFFGFLLAKETLFIAIALDLAIYLFFWYVVSFLEATDKVFNSKK